MRILFVSASGSIYGKEAITLSLMNRLRANGHEVSCLTSTWGNPKFVQALQKQSIPFKKVPLGFISKTLNVAAMRMTLAQIIKLPVLWLGYRRFLKEARPDVVVHTTFHHIFLLWPVMGHRRNVFHVHDFFSATRFYILVFQLLSFRLDRFIAVSKFVAGSLRALGLSKNKISCVLNGVSIQDRSLPLNQEIQETSGRNGTRIGIVGQVGDWKGHEDLVEALKLLNDAGQKFQLKIFGAGDAAFTQKLKSKIRAYGFAENVDWMGFINSRDQIYKQLDVCVVPTRTDEPFGLVAAEALAFGVPVIATRKGGLPEVVKDERVGFLIDARSPDQLAEKLRSFVYSASLKRDVAGFAREYARTHLSDNRMAQQIETILQAVINGGSAELTDCD